MWEGGSGWKWATATPTPPLFYPPSQLAWFREELINATTNCNAMVVVGHHAVYGVSGALAE